MSRPLPRVYVADLPPEARYLPDENLYVCPDGTILREVHLTTRPERYKVMQGCRSRWGVQLRYKCGRKDTKSSLVARLVAQAFVPNPDPDHLDFVRHIDGNLLNNAAGNLCWISHRDAFCDSPKGKQAIAKYGGTQTKTINGVKIKDDETRAAKRAYYASHTQIYLEANRRYLRKKKLKARNQNEHA